MSKRVSLSVIIACAFIATPVSSALAAEIDAMVFEASLFGHFPSSLSTVNRNTDKISLGELSPFLHELQLGYGTSLPNLKSELLFVSGYRYAGADLPSGSILSNKGAETYKLTGIPVLLTLRGGFIPIPILNTLNISFGGTAQKIDYTLVDGESLGGEWGWSWGLRAGVGASMDVGDDLKARLFFQGRLESKLNVDHAPSFSGTGVEVGLSISWRLPRETIEQINFRKEQAKSSDSNLKSFTTDETQSKSRLDRAFEIIREADNAKDIGDYIAAAQLYRRGIGLLPRDPETRKNVEAPVRIDWAWCLYETEQRDKAREVLIEALELDPELKNADELRQRLTLY
ncbi:tetratricopeptide repeat protein [Myxococcota bacterium]|nr:tetratricopeptide repeat protein [Myxococcota bacterium]